MATAVQNPFHLTAAGELGIHRETMLQNELLLRQPLPPIRRIPLPPIGGAHIPMTLSDFNYDRDEDDFWDDLDQTEVGKPKKRGVQMSEGYTYGRPNDRRDGGSTDALHGWPSLATTTLPFKRKERPAERDFMALNKGAVSAGLVTANEQYEYRATHDARRRPTADDQSRSRTRRIPPTMVFGISTRPSTPIFDLLEHKYQDKWLAQRRQMELAKRQEETKKTEEAGQRRTPGCVYETRASLLRTYQNPVEPQPLWQMPRFTKSAQPALQTFRTTKARKSAYDHFGSDKISRKGDFGTGIYESAKN